MTALNLDQLLETTPEELEQEAARENRPSFRTEPIQFEGEWNGEVRDARSEVIQGQTYPRAGLPFTKTKFLQVDPQHAGLYRDGQEYTLLLEVPPATTKDGRPFPKRLTQIGRTTKASGHELKWFAGSRIRVTEMAEASGKNAKGYDQFRYFWKFEKIGDAGSNGATPPAAIPEEQVVAALTFISGGEYTRTNVGMALLKGVGPQSSATLNGKFSDGSFVKEALESGRLKETTDGVLHT